MSRFFLYQLGEYFSIFSSIPSLTLCWFHKEKFNVDHLDSWMVMKKKTKQLCDVALIGVKKPWPQKIMLSIKPLECQCKQAMKFKPKYLGVWSEAQSYIIIILTFLVVSYQGLGDGLTNSCTKIRQGQLLFPCFLVTFTSVTTNGIIFLQVCEVILWTVPIIFFCVSRMQSLSRLQWDFKEQPVLTKLTSPQQRWK